MSKNPIRQSGLKALIEASPPITNFQLANVQIHAGVELALLQRNLTCLNLMRNSLGKEGARIIAENLGPKLKYLNVIDCKLGPEGARAFANALRTNTTLAKLKFRDNNIRCEGATFFAGILNDKQQRKNSLIKIDLYRC